MSEPTPNESREAAPPSSRMMIALVSIAAVCGLGVVLAFQLTEPIITAKKAEALRKAVFQVIPGASQVVTFREHPDGAWAPLAEGDGRGINYHAGYDGQRRLLGVAMEAQGQGYQDVIKVLYGYDPRRESIVGMRVLESKETPGLGDKIGKEPRFLANFHDLDVRLAGGGDGLAHEIEVVKQGTKQERWQIDAITGATISSKAIGRLLNASTIERIPRVVENLKRLEEGR